MLRYVIIILCSAFALSVYASEPGCDKTKQTRRQERAIVKTILPSQQQAEQRFFQEAKTYWRQNKPLETRLYQIEFLANTRKRTNPPTKS